MLTSRFAAVSCAALVAALLAAASIAKGDVLLRKDYLTFSAPFALPGVALPAGSYVFEVIDPSQQIVQVRSRKGSHVYLTAFTRAVRRPKGLGANRQIVFEEVPAGVTTPVKAWYPNGDAAGHEFIYARGSLQLRHNGSN